MHRIFYRLKGIEFHFDLETPHIQTGAGQQLVHHLAGGGLGIEADKAKPVKVVLGELAQAGQGMLGGQHQRQLIAGIGHHLEQVVELRGQLAPNDGQIDLAIGHTPAGAPGAVHLKLHSHIRVFLAEQANHAGHQIGARGLAGAHHQGPAFEVVQIIEGPAGLLALTQDAIAVAEQKVASLGELGLTATAVKQRDIELLLQILDLQTHRRLGHIEAVRRLLEAALAGNRPQDAQLIEGKRQVCHWCHADQNSRGPSR